MFSVMPASKRAILCNLAAFAFALAAANLAAVARTRSRHIPIVRFASSCRSARAASPTSPHVLSPKNSVRNSAKIS